LYLFFFSQALTFLYTFMSVHILLYARNSYIEVPSPQCIL